MDDKTVAHVTGDCAQAPFQPKVSIVVPVYNVEPYLDRCMESLVHQTLEDIEIILVDDGARDKSPEMCDEWASRDKRIHVIHQQNGGLSAARNTGVAHATGEFVGFVDPDDYVDLDMYRHLYGNIKKEQADIAICGAFNCYPNGLIEAAQREGYWVCDAREALYKSLDGRDIMVTAVTRLYPRELAIKVPFPVGKIQEDAFTAVDFLLDAQKVVIDLAPLYYYEHREGTLSSKPYAKGSTMDLVEAWKRNYDLVVNRYPDLKTAALFRLLWAHFDVLDAMFVEGAENDPETKQKLVAFLRKHVMDTVQSPHFRVTRKVAAVALKVSVNAYKALSCMQRRRLWK